MISETHVPRAQFNRLFADAMSQLAVVTAERDQARQMLADAPHEEDCVSLNTLREVRWPDLCDCWKAGL